MKCDFVNEYRIVVSRTPQGVRGLKSQTPIAVNWDYVVAPRKGCVD